MGLRPARATIARLPMSSAINRVARSTACLFTTGCLFSTPERSRRMKFKLQICTILSLLALLLPSAATPATYAAGTAYVEPALLNSATTSVSVVVAAATSQAAATAVAAHAGQVTSDLWIINSVVATLPTREVLPLASTPGI